MSRPFGNRNKKRNPFPSKDTDRKRRERKREDAVKLDEWLRAEAEQARAANPDGDPAFLYQGTQAKLLPKKLFDSAAERLKRRR